MEHFDWNVMGGLKMEQIDHRRMVGYAGCPDERISESAACFPSNCREEKGPWK
jgi:hypothetical protein